MKTNILLRLLIIIFLLGFLVTSVQAEKKEIVKTFKNKTRVDISTVSGDCLVKIVKGNQIKVQLLYDYPEDCFEPVFVESGSTLELEEDFSGSCSGRSIWKLFVPEKTRIKFKSASGDFAANGLRNSLYASTASGDFELNNIEGDIEIKSASGDLEASDIKGSLEVKTASGDLEVENISGSIDIRTASGDIDAQHISGDDISIKGASSDIEVSDARGTLEIKTASGEIEAEDIFITGKSEFKTASGDVRIELAQSCEHSLVISSASGDAILNYNGNPIVGYFELSAKEEDGTIEAPFKFDKEEIVVKYGQRYMKKSFTRKSQTPRIIIRTASGKAALEE
jgi:hypothetical protein